MIFFIQTLRIKLGKVKLENFVDLYNLIFFFFFKVKSN